MALRLAGLHRDPGEGHPRPGEVRLDHVVRALAHPGGREHQVGVAQVRLQRREQRPRAVGHDRRGHRDPARSAHGGGQHRAVRVVDLRGTERLPRRDELRAGGQHDDPRRAVHPDGRPAHPGQQPDDGGRDDGARGQDHRAGPDVLAAPAHVGSGPGQDVDAHPLGPRIRLLDGDDRAGALGDRGARHHPGRRAGHERGARHPAGGDVVDDPQRDRDRGGRVVGVQVVRVQGVAVHRGVVEGRQVHGGGDVLREHQAQRVGHRALLDGPGDDTGQHGGPVLLDGAGGDGQAAAHRPTVTRARHAEVGPRSCDAPDRTP